MRKWVKILNHVFVFTTSPNEIDSLMPWIASKPGGSQSLG